MALNIEAMGKVYDWDEHKAALYRAMNETLEEMNAGRIDQTVSWHDEDTINLEHGEVVPEITFTVRRITPES